LLQHDYQSDLEKVFYIMSQCAKFKDMRLGGIQRLILPPMRLGQYRIYNDKEVPLGYASWALLSDELSEGYKNNTYNMQAQDWDSGNNLWLINILCPRGGGSVALRRLDKLRKEMGLSKKVNFKRLGSNRVNNVKRI
jgi:cytolysin-activating lysine-acyltransferase